MQLVFESLFVAHLFLLLADLRDKLPCDSDPGEFSYALDSGRSPEQPADGGFPPFSELTIFANSICKIT